MISANVLIEKLLGLGRVPDEVEQDWQSQYADAVIADAIASAKVTADAVSPHVDMGRLDFELHLPPSAPGWVTGTADVWPVRSYSLHAPQPDRCPYCGSKSTNDERGNCAACGGPR